MRAVKEFLCTRAHQFLDEVFVMCRADLCAAVGEGTALEEGGEGRHGAVGRDERERIALTVALILQEAIKRGIECLQMAEQIFFFHGNSLLIDAQ